MLMRGVPRLSTLLALLAAPVGGDALGEHRSLAEGGSGTMVRHASDSAARALLAERSGLPEAADDEARRYAVVFDFDTDSCYPAPAVFSDGTVNGGLKIGGDICGQCRERDQLKTANTYHRTVSVREGGVMYAVHMYALYFEKDQIAPVLGGHRHDWEYALVWTKNGEVTHASYSTHGDVVTRPRDELHFAPGEPDTVKIVYHKDDIKTHAFRFAKESERGVDTAENELGRWITPAIVSWSLMQADGVSNANLRRKLNQHDFGSANCHVNDRNFPIAIAKNPPRGYPSSEAWKKAGGR